MAGAHKAFLGNFYPSFPHWMPKTYILRQQSCARKRDRNMCNPGPCGHRVRIIAGSRVEDLPGIEQVVRIDCPLYLPEEIKACFAQLAPEEPLLCQADAVFARNRAP